MADHPLTSKVADRALEVQLRAHTLRKVARMDGGETALLKAYATVLGTSDEGASVFLEALIEKADAGDRDAQERLVFTAGQMLGVLVEVGKRLP